MSDAVLFEERPTPHGRAIGLATLNAPKALNAVSHEMVELLLPRLRQWADDPAIAMVVLRGAGDRAFCAGGDLHGLYRGLTTGDTTPAPGLPVPAGVEAFFSQEYRLDHLIHTYPKPMLCWGNGVVMGGGMGLMVGASHRVITEQSRLAMPEITIGLFPDVGGSWFLNQVPEGAGLFLALTASQLRGADALYAGWADHHVPHAHQADVLDALVAQEWGADRNANDVTLTRILTEAETLPEPAVGPLQSHRDVLREICAHDTLEQVIGAIHHAAGADPWLYSANANLKAGAPGTARLAFELLRRTAGWSLADVFRLELEVALHCAAQPDIREGIRALLIDKDKQPKWHPASLGEADAEWVERFFVPVYEPAVHPLNNLS
jgi:enoyl-CoA hydratase/carnithine racemase